MENKVIDDVITVTSKGTFTLPVKMRRLLGISSKGDKLLIRLYPEAKQAVISKPADFKEIQKLTFKHVKPDKKPLVDVDQFYQAARSKT